MRTNTIFKKLKNLPSFSIFTILCKPQQILHAGFIFDEKATLEKSNEKTFLISCVELFIFLTAKPTVRYEIGELLEKWDRMISAAA